MAELTELGANFTSSRVVLPGGAESVVISSPKLGISTAAARACILGWAQVRAGAGATSLIAQIRRGAGSRGGLVGRAVPEDLAQPPGRVRHVTIFVGEERSGVAEVQYSLTLTQTDTVYDGAVLQAGVMVFIL